MLISDKQFVLIQFLVARNKRIDLPCIAFTSPSSISRGLMFVERMSRSVGAFFVFEKSGYHSAWMKNTGVPLTIAWISEQGLVTEIVNGVPYDQTSIGGNISSKYMIEVTRNWFEKNGIIKGTRIKLSRLKESGEF